MIPEKVFHQILGLGDAWRVSRVDYVEKESNGASGYIFISTNYGAAWAVTATNIPGVFFQAFSAVVNGFMSLPPPMAANWRQ
jgi:hypothetical protein